MIWIWICACVSFVVRLFGPPDLPLPKINQNAPCPSCGHTDGHIRAVQDTTNRMVVQHSCHVCKAIWQELPVVRGRVPVIAATKPDAA